MSDQIEVTSNRAAGLLGSLLAGVSIIGLGLAGATPAFAQDAGEEAAPPSTAAADESEVAEGEDAIVITGIRASLRSAVQVKRNAEQIVDSITSQDIGALPDRSISEALQRVPGITLQRTSENRDPARLSAEGGAVFIRGLNWTRSELNGRDTFSANSGRAIGFEDISSDLVARVDVYKNPSADRVEGSIAGIIDLVTRKPFDQSGQLIAASIDYNYADMRKKGFISGNALYSNRWNLGEAELGILVSYSLGNIGNRTDSFQTDRYLDFNANDGLANFVPAGMGIRRVDWEQKRETFNGSLQFRPVHNLLFTFEGTIAKATPEDIEHNTFVANPQSDPSYQFDSEGVLTSGNLEHVDLTFNTRSGYAKRVTKDFSGKVEWSPTDNWNISADVQRVRSTGKVVSMTSFTQFGIDQSMRPGFAFDISGNTPSMSFTENADMSDQGNYWWAAAMDHLEDNEAGSWAERLDVEYEFEDSFFKSFKLGARATQRKLTTRQTGYNWSLLSHQYWGGGDPVYLDQDPGGTGLPGQSHLFNYSNFFRGDDNSPGQAWFGAPSLVSNGTANAYEYLKDTLSAGWGWVPYDETAFDDIGRPDNVLAGTIPQREKTQAAYALLRFGSDDSAIGRFDGNIGLRVVETRNETVGQINVAALGDSVMSPAACLAAHSQAECQGLIDAYAWVGQPGRETFEAENKYTNVLPSLNLRFFLQEDLQLRLAAAKAIFRPRFDQMVPFQTYSFNFLADNFTLNPANPAVLSGGNPYLEPIKSNQFDASLEYYFGGAGGMLTFAAFYKDIRDYIFAGGEPTTVTRNGTTFEFTNQGQSQGEKGKIKGFEIGYQQFYDFLPGALGGLGLQANFTYVDSSGGRNPAINTLDPNQVNNAADQTLPLEGLSKYSYNVALLYERFGISARLAYNWRSSYLLTTSAANSNTPAWSDDYGQLDGSILYSVTPNIKVGIQATNILDSRTYLHMGGAEFHPRYSWTETDRRVAFLVRTRF